MTAVLHKTWRMVERLLLPGRVARRARRDEEMAAAAAMIQAGLARDAAAKSNVVRFRPRCMSGGHGFDWTPWSVTAPPINRDAIEIGHVSWRKPIVAFSDVVGPELNVAGLYWRPHRHQAGKA